jgi:DNA-binding NarL/FixJ family response regulator
MVFLLERLLSNHGFTVAGTAADGEQGITTVKEAQPEVVLLDLAMPTLDGEAALPTIVLDAPRTMIVILSAHVTPERARALFARGAFCVYEKADLGAVPAALDEDLRLFHRVLDGEDAMPSLRRRYQRP